jgi:hypothetical protein
MIRPVFADIPLKSLEKANFIRIHVEVKQSTLSTSNNKKKPFFIPCNHHQDNY